MQSLWARLGWLVKATVFPPNCHVHCVANDLDSYLGLIIAAKQLVNQKLIPVAKTKSHQGCSSFGLNCLLAEKTTQWIFFFHPSCRSTPPGQCDLPP